MPAVLMNASFAKLADLRRTFLGTLEFHLFSNNHVPVRTDVVGDYTDATFLGYSPISGGTWGAGFLNGGSNGETDLTTLVWTATGGGNQIIYGVYVIDPATGLLVYAEKASISPSVGNPGDTYSYSTPWIVAQG